MTRTLQFSVIGEPRMHCASCEQRISRVLLALEGVRKVSADARSQRIDVLTDAGKVDADAIVGHLERLGYRVQRNDQESSAHA